MTFALLTGAIVGAGVLLIVRGLYPARLSLAQALTELHRVPSEAPIVTATSATGRWSMQLGASVLTVTQGLGLRPRSLSTDLRILDRSMERHYAEKAMLAVLGLTLAPATTVLLSLGGVSVPWTIPLWVSLIMAAGGFFVPDLGIKADADKRRQDFRHALGSFLDLVVVALAGGGGIESALGAAANTGDGWAFLHLRRALETSRVSREAPWSALGRLGSELGVPELTELAASVGLAGTEGARIRQSVAAKAASLRTHLLSEAETEAQSASERMSLSVVLLFAGFLLFVGFPAVAQVAMNL